jgi:hypothetical protein
MPADNNPGSGWPNYEIPASCMVELIVMYGCCVT